MAELKEKILEHANGELKTEINKRKVKEME